MKRQVYIKSHLAIGFALYQTNMESSWDGLTQTQKNNAKRYLRKRLRFELRASLGEPMTSELVILADLVTAQFLTSVYDATVTTTIAAMLTDIAANGLT